MANSKRKTILNYIRDTTLAYITTAHGYNYDIQTNKRGLLEMDSPADSAFPAVFIALTQETRENITSIQGKARLQVMIEGYVKNSTGTDGLQQNIDDLIEDVTRAFERDRTLGGLSAKWIEIKSIKSDESDNQGYGAFLMVVEVVYVTEQTLP